VTLDFEDLTYDEQKYIIDVYANEKSGMYPDIDEAKLPTLLQEVAMAKYEDIIDLYLEKLDKD
jgi:hypothetical protein